MPAANYSIPARSAISLSGWNGTGFRLRHATSERILSAMSTATLTDNFRANIVRAMRRRGLTQTELARLAGLRIATVCDVLRGEVEPSIDTCSRMAAAAGLRPEKVFSQNVKSGVDTLRRSV